MLNVQSLCSTVSTAVLREAALLERLGNHPNVVRFCGACVATVPRRLVRDIGSAAAATAADAEAEELCMWIVTEFYPLGNVKDYVTQVTILLLRSAPSGSIFTIYP